MNLMKLLLIFFVSVSFVWTSCSSTKGIPQNDKLYTGASVKVKAPASIIVVIHGATMTIQPAVCRQCLIWNFYQKALT